MFDVRLIIDPPLRGPWNMAVDEALLADDVETDAATLRFYRWSEPTLSLGYFQSYADRELHAASRGCAVVRRQSGGGAILHDRELTYSLVLPPTNPLAQTPRSCTTRFMWPSLPHWQKRCDQANQVHRCEFTVKRHIRPGKRTFPVLPTTVVGRRGLCAET